MRATVKWFNTAKGFGFVTPSDGSPEAFLHLSALKQAGYESVGEGASVTVEIGSSPKGRQVLRVMEVDNSTAQPSAPRAPRAPYGDRGGSDRSGWGGGGGGDRGGWGGGGGNDRGGWGGGGGGGGGDRGGYQAPVDLSNAESMDGVVKWFSGLKGYGFVQPNGGGKDVFVHITVLRNAGLQSLAPGQPVRMKVVTARKGPEAVTVELNGPIGAPPA
ncbi:MAG: cold shock domain-containing protein [Rhodospirillales bacterium]|nr:cold shock domain-containing protein [Rhodospirillales bacterium]